MILLRVLGLAGTALLLGAAGPDLPSVKAQSPVAAGEYLVAIGGCNDCHTEGWMINSGKVPEAQRLTGRQSCGMERSVGHVLSDQPAAAGAEDVRRCLGAARAYHAATAAHAVVQHALDERGGSESDVCVYSQPWSGGRTGTGSAAARQAANHPVYTG